jgi:dihydrolipoamide dehydrogenase
VGETKQYDLIVIGAGPAGYVGAIRASQLGLSSCVIEKEKPGGVCLNIGCIPSKALINQASIFSSIKQLEEMGVKVDVSEFDYEKVFKKSRKAADTLSKGVNFLLKKNGVDLISGTGKITGANEVTVNGETKLSAEQILVATGSAPIEIRAFPVDEKTVLTSNGALMLTELPTKLIILGGGYIGCEFAYVMNSFGVEVIIVEMLDQILPMEDTDVADQLAKAFKKRKIVMHTSTKAESMTKTDNGIELTLSPSEGETFTVDAEKLLVVVGRTPNTADIGLETVGIETERGFIPVGDFYQTSTPSIYAVGDVVRTPLLAHVASKEAEIAVEHMAGHSPEPRIDPNLIPAAVYTEPQVGSFGLNEKKAKEAGIAYSTAVFPYRGAGKAVAVEHSEGFVKLLYDETTKEILGAQVIGADATELIHEILLAKKAELLPEDIATMIHAHPTLSEAVMEAHRVAEGWAIHI